MLPSHHFAISPTDIKIKIIEIIITVYFVNDRLSLGSGMCFFFILLIFFHFPFPSHCLLYIRHSLT